MVHAPKPGDTAKAANSYPADTKMCVSCLVTFSCLITNLSNQHLAPNEDTEGAEICSARQFLLASWSLFRFVPNLPFVTNFSLKCLTK